MKYSIGLLLLILCSGLFGQDFIQKKTSDHILVPGTNIFMVPPKGFNLPKDFKGFRKTDDLTSSIMIVEIPGPYSEVSKGFNADDLAQNGMNLISKRNIRINKKEGLILNIEQEAAGYYFAKEILVYGDEKSTTLINGSWLKKDEEIGNEIRQSILTTYLEDNMEINPREALDYTINEVVGNLKFLSVMGNGMIFNRDLKTPTESIDKASLITDKSFAYQNIENRKLFCISRIQKYPGDYSIIPDRGINEIEIDGLSGYELFATNNENESEEIYQVILFTDDGGYYIFFGTYKTGSPEAITDIKNTIKTFKRNN